MKLYQANWSITEDSDWFFLPFLGSSSWPNYVGDMVLLTLVSEACLALSF